MYSIYKSSSHVVTSHHSLVPYSIISLYLSSASSSHRRRFPGADRIRPLRQLNPGSFVLLYFRLFTFSDLY